MFNLILPWNDVFVIGSRKMNSYFKLYFSQSAHGKNCYKKTTQIINQSSFQNMPSFHNKFFFKNVANPTYPTYISRFTWVLLSVDVHIKHTTGISEEIIISAFKLYYTALSNICMYSLVIPLDFASPKSPAGRMPPLRADLQYKWVCHFY